MSVDIDERHVSPAPILDDEGAIAPLGLPTPRRPAQTIPSAGPTSRLPRRPVSGRAIAAAAALAAVIAAIALVVVLSGGQSAPAALHVRAGAFTAPLQNLSTSLTQSLERIQAERAAARLRAVKRKLVIERRAKAHRRAAAQRRAVRRRAAARRRAATAAARPPARAAPAPPRRPAAPPPSPPADEFPF